MHGRIRLPLILTAIVLALLACLLAGGFDFFLVPQPAPRPAKGRGSAVTVNADGSRSTGQSLAFEREGLAAGLLTGRMEQQAEALVTLFPASLANIDIAFLNRFDPSWRWLLLRFLAYRYRSWLHAFPPEIQKSLSALTTVLPDALPYRTLAYSRWLLFQAFLELDQAWYRPPAVAGAAFGFAGPKRTLLAHNFDWERSRAFDRNKVVQLVRSESGLSFLAVGWPGFMGIVSGMNEAGLGLALMPGPAHGPGAGHGQPLSLLARRVLEQARTLEDAEAQIRSARVSASASFLIGSGPERRFMAVEKTPERTVVRAMQDKYLLAVGHFQSEEWAGDADNARVENAGPSAARLYRLKELLGGLHGACSVEQAVRILRDNRGQFELPLGWGHPSAIQSFRTTQAVVFDLTSRTAWVSAAPSPLGRFIPFRLDRFSERGPEAVIPEDVFLASGQYWDYQRYRRGLTEAERLLASGRNRETLALLMELHPLNPNDYQLYLLAGRALLAMKRWDEAYYNFSEAKKRHPAYLEERQEIDSQLEKLEKRR